jgi:hypothetical protein
MGIIKTRTGIIMAVIILSTGSKEKEVQGVGLIDS